MLLTCLRVFNLCMCGHGVWMHACGCRLCAVAHVGWSEDSPRCWCLLPTFFLGLSHISLLFSKEPRNYKYLLPPLALCRSWGFELMSLHLQGKCFTSWAISSPPIFNLNVLVNMISNNGALTMCLTLSRVLFHVCLISTLRSKTVSLMLQVWTLRQEEVE